MLLEIGRRVAAVVLDVHVLAILCDNQSGLQLHFTSRVVIDGLDGGGDEHEAVMILYYLAERRMVPHLAKKGGESSLEKKMENEMETRGI